MQRSEPGFPKPLPPLKYLYKGGKTINKLFLTTATTSHSPTQRKMEGPRLAWTVKAIIVIVFTSILFRCVCGANQTVGGASGWDLVSNIQAWSSSTTFNIGDDLVFTYTPVHDVVEVNRRGYDTCTIANALATYNTGETVIHLTEEGTRYFVCGRMGHCQQGLKLQVQVLAQSNNNGTAAPPPPPHPRHRRHPPGPPSPDGEAPAEVEAEPPCDCSRAEHNGNGLVTSITLVIIFAFARFHFFFGISHLLVYT